MSSPVSTEEFLRTVWGVDDKGIAELAILNKNKFFQAFPFTWPDSLDTLLFSARNHNKAANIFYGVLLRTKPWPYPTGRKNLDGSPELAKRGREDNVLLGNCVWCEFDFYDPSSAGGHKGRVIDPETARKWLKEFPLKPSIVLRSGGGIQVLWLLKEPVKGDDVWKIKSVNKALCDHFKVVRDKKEYGADNQAFDLARCLRLPGTINHKYSPPRKAEISFWDPNQRYTLDDFDMLPQEDCKPLSAPADGYAGSGPTEGGARPLPLTELEAEKIAELVKLTQSLWQPGLRHKMALQISGWLALSDVHFDSALTVICGVSDSVGGDTHDRKKAVEDTYKNFVNGGKVQGRPALESLIDTDFPELAKTPAKKVLDKIQKLLPKKANGGGGRGGAGSGAGCDPDFDIIRIIKYDSRPARYVVVIQKLGQSAQVEVPCEIEIFGNIKKFRLAFMESTPDNQSIAPIKQWRWEYMVANSPNEVKPAPQEASAGGSIKAKLEGFIEERKEQPELGELKTFPGYNDTEIYFQLDAFRRRLRDAGVKVADREITHILRDEGWNDDRRWVGNKNPRLWVKAIVKGGGGNGNGHGPGPTPSEPITPADLFVGQEIPSQGEAAPSVTPETEGLDDEAEA